MTAKVSETEIMREVADAVGRTRRAVVSRNNVGFDDRTRVKYGLGKGSADLVGFLFESGRFFAIEVKTPTGRLSKEQKLWINFVNKCGGYACVARSVDEALGHLQKAIEGEKHEAV